MSWFRKDPPPAAEPEGPLAEFVTLTIPGKHFKWTLKPHDDLTDLVDIILERLKARDTGELAMIESVDKPVQAAIVYLDGPNAERLCADMLTLINHHPLCQGATVSVDVDINELRDGKARREFTLPVLSPGFGDRP